MTDPADVSDEPHEQLARLGGFFRRAALFWRTAACIVAVGVVAGAVFLFLRRPTFRSETVILYSEGMRPADDTDRPETSRSVTLRLKEILMSRSSLDAVAKEFDLYPDIRRTRGPVDAVEELRKHVEFRAPGGDTFSIAFTGGSPAEARNVTARLAALVIGQDSDLRKKQALVARDFLESERNTTESHLRDAERALAAFMGAHPRFALDATPLATGAAVRASMGAATAAAAPAPAYGAFRPRSAVGAGVAGGAGAPVGPAPSASEDRESAEEASRAAAALAAAQANLADLSAHFTAAHPDVRAAQAEADRAKARFAVATAAAAAARPRAPPAAPPQPAEVEAAPPPRTPLVSPASPRASAGPSPAPAPERDVVALETEWVKLTRGVTEARQHQDQVEAALFKANIAVSSETGGHGVQVTMIDPAFLPQSATPPGRTVIAAMFLGLSLLLGILVAIVRALLDDRIRSGRDAAHVIEVLAEVPRSSNRRAHVTG